MIRWIASALAGGTLALSPVLTPAAAAQAPSGATQYTSAAQPPAADPPAAADPPPAAPNPAPPPSAAAHPRAAAPMHALTLSEDLSGPRAALEAAGAGNLTALPPLPSAKNSTIFGGAIRKIDPVRDQFLLDIYGQHPMKVLFDERTQVYRDGSKIPVQDLRPAEHASVQTALDGTQIFAISVHILSSIPQGHYRGRVLRFNDSSGELQIDASPSPRPFTVTVPGSATIVRMGQTEFTAQGSGRGDLRRGSLVDVTFATGRGTVGVASKIMVLAVPGASFQFSGNITALNVGAGTLALVDPRDQKTYQISFNPSAFPRARDLHVGERVRLSANYDGTSYIATEIIPY